jgi:hypothetical protein
MSSSIHHVARLGSVIEQCAHLVRLGLGIGSRVRVRVRVCTCILTVTHMHMHMHMHAWAAHACHVVLLQC